MYVYCLFCDTTKCNYVVHAATQLMPCEASSPKQVQHTYVSATRRMEDRLHQLLPGYVFLYSQEPLKITDIRQIPDIIRVMRNQDDAYELAGPDEAFAMMLYHRNGVLGKTEVHEDDGILKFRDGAFAGLKAFIRKVDRRNHRMYVEIFLLDQQVKTWLEYEIVEKKPSSRNPGL